MCLLFYFILLFHPVSFTALMGGGEAPPALSSLGEDLGVQ